MVNEDIINPSLVVPRGNVIGSDMGYLENNSIFSPINSEISEETINIGDLTLNALKIIPTLSDIISYTADQFIWLWGGRIEGTNFILGNTDPHGSIKTNNIYIRDRLENITDNLIPIEITNINNLVDMGNDLNSEGNIQEMENCLIFNDYVEILGYNTINQRYIPIEPNTEYTFSCNLKTISEYIRIGIICYDEGKVEIDKKYSDYAKKGENTDDLILFLTTSFNDDTKFVSFFLEPKTIENNPNLIINNLMFNEGLYKSFVEGSESEIINSAFENLDFIQISTIHNANFNRNPQPTVTIEVRDQNNNLIKSQTNMDLLTLDIKEDLVYVKYIVIYVSIVNPNDATIIFSQLKIQGA